MTEDAKTFKRIVQDLLDKHSVSDSMSDTIIDEQVSNTFSAKGVLGLNLTDEDKNSVRNELLADNKIRLEPGIAIVPRTHKKWFAERKPELNLDYWDRFKELLVKDKGFPVNVVAEMDKVSDEIVDLLGDPTRTEEREQRRGLIIGDVQSGKTVNYSGAICKAVDAGFRAIILMTGTTNDLRKQTQIRLDEAFTGIDTGSETLNFIGVGNYNKKLRPISFTTVDKDFSKSAAKQLSSALSQSDGDRPMLFVIKKNVSVLRSLHDWIKTHNQYGENKIDGSVLMIDDEADYASINTKAAGEDRSKTNEYIEEILNVFRFASYVGFTATPYANVFIDPETDEDMEKEGLFPKDYIYTLSAPSNYIGARNIFPVNSKYRNMLRTIKDGEKYYPSRHKKDDDLSELSNSLRDAVNTFLLANVIRDLRNDSSTHRSMMVNVTRFVNTQQLVRKAVRDYVDDVKRSIKNYASLPTARALKDEHLQELNRTFKHEYGHLEFTWEHIQAKLFESVLPIQVYAAHGGGDDLNYEDYEDGLRTIVVGGQRLSRGLTLEGLIVSYLYRNSMAYDTLMQMGRWFGYRKNYDDVCRLWMDKVSQNWYAFISEATDELREEVKRLRDIGATPLDFGLKVRNDPDIPLIVTARNKMRSAQSKTISKSLSGKAVETPFVHNNANKNEANLNAVISLVESEEFQPVDNQYAAYSVPREKVLAFLNKIEVPSANAQFNPESIAQFILQYAGNELNSWDVAILSGKSDLKYQLSNEIKVTPNIRKFDYLKGDASVIRMSGSKRRLGSQGNTRFGLTKEQINHVKELVFANPERGSVNDDDYFAIDRKPLLMIYFVEPSPDSNAEDIEKLDNFKGEPLIGFGLGIPKLGNVATKYIRYQTNKIHQEFGGIDEYEDEDD
jgi:hypothetical protein